MHRVVLKGDHKLMMRQGDEILFCCQCGNVPCTVSIFSRNSNEMSNFIEYRSCSVDCKLSCNCFFLGEAVGDLWHMVCSCYSAVIEHTNRVIFLEDDDVAAVVDGRLSIHRIKRTAGDHPGRAVQTLQMELQQIMKGKVF